MGCVEESELVAYARNDLAPPAATRVDEHLASCAACRRLMFALASSRPIDRETGAVAARDRLGRYIVGDQLGAGAMGTVFAGRDPELDRRVALKVLRGEPTPERQDRLVREARTLAQLSHPNIVAVYDVGRSGDEVFLAMELLDGCDLKRWLADGARSWRTIVALFLEVGKGLAAAHAVGIVHRDLKPQNIFVERSGRVCVTDFGLARIDPPLAPLAPDAATATPHTHGLIGTPAYMAAEQLARATADARSDQFSYCVSLYEALYGERPFEADTIEGLHRRILAGRVAPPRPRRGVPAWIRRVVLRGLSAAPEDRFPSMAALVAALARDPWRWPRRAAIALALGALIATASVVGMRELDARDQRCKTPARRFAGVWDAGRKASIQRGFLASGAPYAADAWREVERALDAYATGWVTRGTESCEAQVRGEQSPEAGELRMRCLEDQAASLDALVEVLDRVDNDILAKATQLAQRLPATAWCNDLEALRSVDARPLDPVVRARATSLNHALARATILVDAGKPAQGLALASQLAAQATALGVASVEAQGLVTLARAQQAMGDAKTAAASFREAALRSDSARRDELRAGALIALAAMTGDALARPDDARAIARSAAAVIDRLRNRSDLTAELENANGVIEQFAGSYEAAHQHFAQALALWTKVEGERSMKAALVLRNLAIVDFERNRFADAETYVARSLAIMAATVGPAHPAMAKNFSLQGDIYWRTGKTSEALASHRRAVAVAESALGADHPDLAWLRNNLGGVLGELKQLDEALVVQQRAVATFQKAFGPAHPDTAMAINGLGQLALAKGDLATALGHGRAALAIREKALGPAHPRVAYDLALIAAALVRLHRPGEAIEPIERALAMRIKRDVDSEEVAESRFELARALWDARRDRPRAIQLARQAHAYVTRAGPALANPALPHDIAGFLAAAAPR